MTIPTSDEIRAAHVSVDAEGPLARTTRDLGVLALKDPFLKTFIENVLRSLDTGAPRFDDPRRLIHRAAITGALMGGLNLGIRIGEARAKREAPSEYPCANYEPFVSEFSGEWCAHCSWTKGAHEFHAKMRGEAR